MAAVALIGLTPDIESTVRSALRDEGHVVTTLALHMETVERLAQVGFDLVVMDGFPLVNVEAFVEQLRSRERTRALPVIVVCAQKALPQQEGVVQLPLPFELLALLAAVKKLGDRADGTKREGWAYLNRA